MQLVTGSNPLTFEGCCSRFGQLLILKFDAFLVCKWKAKLSMLWLGCKRYVRNDCICSKDTNHLISVSL